PYRQLGADNRLDAGGNGGFVEARDAVDAVAIEERERWIPERHRAIDQDLWQSRALQKTERRCRVELDVRHHTNATTEVTERTWRSRYPQQSMPCPLLCYQRPPCSPWSCFSIDDRFDEPATGFAILEDAVDRAIGERDLPFVVNPARIRPPLTRRPPRSGAA